MKPSTARTKKSWVELLLHPSTQTKKPHKLQVQHKVEPHIKVLLLSHNTCCTFSNNWNDVSSSEAGLADSWSSDVGPVNHLLHTVVGHSDHHAILVVKEEKDQLCIILTDSCVFSCNTLMQMCQMTYRLHDRDEEL